MKISELMSRNPCTVTPDTPVSEAARVMKEQDVGLVPVVERASGTGSGERLVGIVTDRDLAVRHLAAGRTTDVPVRDVMSSGVRTCGPDDSVDSVMELMGREQVRRVPIVDERGSLVGVVSQADLARKASNDGKVERTVERISRPGGAHQS